MLCILLVANWAEIKANSLPDTIPIITDFYASNDEPDVDEELTLSWNIDWVDIPLDSQLLFINYGDGSGIEDISDRIDNGWIKHTYSIQGKYQITLRATNYINGNSSISSIIINVINKPTNFDISLTTSIEVNTASYNFESDTPAPRSQLRGPNNSKYDPAGWIDLQSLYQLDDVVVRKTDGVHGQVMELRDLSQFSAAHAVNTFSSQQSEGTVEFWVQKSFSNPKPSSNSLDTGLYVRLLNTSYPIQSYSDINDGDIAIEFRLDEGNDNKIMYHNGQTYVETGNLYGDFDWYHIRIDFYCVKNTYDLFINGFLIGQDLPFRNASMTITNLLFQTSPFDSHYAGSGNTYLGGWYVDSVGYSWEDYTPGDNFAYKGATYEFREDDQIYLFASQISDYRGDLADLLFYWSMGDGTAQQQGCTGVAYNWKDAGIYPITLTITDNQGAITTKIINITINNVAPNPDFNYAVDAPSTYGFNYDLAEQDPLGWRIYDGADYMPQEWFTEKNESIDIVCATPKVINWKDGRYKVVEFQDESSFDTSAMQMDSPLGVGVPWVRYGTVEFWFQTTDAQKGFTFYIGGSFADRMDAWWLRGYGYDDDIMLPLVGETNNAINNLQIRVKDNNWQYSFKENQWDEYLYYNFSEFYQPIQNNEWYHISIDFNLDRNTQYATLGYNQLKMRINDESSDAHAFLGYDEFLLVNYFGFSTDIVDTDYSCYVESIGLSWDQNYQVGDNLKAYQNSYKGTYDFLFEPEGKFPDGLNDLPWKETNDQNCNSKIIPKLIDHTNVLWISDENATGSAQISNVWLGEPEFGTVEWWVYIFDLGKTSRFTLDFSGSSWLKVDIRVDNWQWEYYAGSGLWEPIQNVLIPETQKWQHVRVDFDRRPGGGYLGLPEDSFYVTIDNFSYYRSPPLEMANSLSGEDAFRISTAKADYWISIPYVFCVDSIGYSWDRNYHIGDNLNLQTGFYEKSAVVFTANDNIDTKSDSDKLKYFWIFDDNSTGYGKGIIHQYTRGGKYKVSLIVKDDNDAIGRITKEVIIENFPPEVKILPPSRKASYTFSDEEVGTMPSDWSRGIAMGWLNLNSSVIVEQNVEGRRNVLAFEPVTPTPAACVGELPLIGNFDNYLDMLKKWLANSSCEIEGKEYFSQNDAHPLNLSCGTVEFFLYADSLSDVFTLWFMQTVFYGLIVNVPDGINVFTQNGYWYAVNYGSDFQEYLNPTYEKIEGIPLMTEKEWNHVRIDWCCDDSGYLGLGKSKFTMALNGVPSPFTYSMNDINYTAFFKTISGEGITENPLPELWPESLKAINVLNFMGIINNGNDKFYLDAMGVSWDPNYAIGDNLLDPYIINEGESYYFETTSNDGVSDYMRLEYYWGQSNLTGIEGLEESGWTCSYCWYDDAYLDQTMVYVKDTEGAFAVDYSDDKVKISNVDPSLALYNASCSNVVNITPLYTINVTMSITGYFSKYAEFYLETVSDNVPQQTFSLVKNKWQFCATKKDMQIIVDITKNWTIVVNYTKNSGFGEFWVYLTFNLPNNDSFTMTHRFRIGSNKQDGAWIIDPNSWWRNGAAPISRQYITMSVFGPFCKYANFSLEVIADNVLQETYSLVKNKWQICVTRNHIPIDIDLTKDWMFVVNYTKNTSPGIYWVYLTFEFPNKDSFMMNHKFQISFKKADDGWIIDPNEWWLNNASVVSEQYVSFQGSIFDPSVDDLSLFVDRKMDALLKVNFTSSSFNTKFIKQQYSFDTDIVGSVPKGWTYHNDVSVVDSLGGHSMVVAIRDDNPTDYSNLGQSFEDGDQSSGTIALDLRVSDLNVDAEQPSVTIGAVSTLPGQQMEYAMVVYLWHGDWYLYGVSPSGQLIYEKLCNATANRWYRIILEFDFTDNKYEGLQQGEFRATIDGTYSASAYMYSYMNSQKQSVVGFGALTTVELSNYQVYVDNVEYKFPVWEEHLPTGVATYNFTNDVLGTMPQGWSDSHPHVPVSLIKNSSSVIAELDGHEKVVAIKDNDTTKIAGLFTEFSNQEFGTIELWLRTSKAVSESESPVMVVALLTWNGAQMIFGGVVYVYQGFWAIGGPGATEPLILTVAEPDRWYHCRIDFELTDDGYMGLASGQFKGTIDAKYSAVSNLAQKGNGTNQYLNQFAIYTSTSDADYYIYIDDVGFSWDPSYTVGVNLNILKYIGYYSNTFTLSSAPNEVTCSVEIWRRAGTTYAQFNVSQNLYKETFLNNAFPAYVEFNASFKITPLNVNFSKILNASVGLSNVKIIDTLQLLNYIELRTEDDDGGRDALRFEMLTSGNGIDLKNAHFSPIVDLAYAPEEGEEDADVSFVVKVGGNIGNATVTSNYSVNWNFGDRSGIQAGYLLNNSYYCGTHVYTQAGTYLCTAIVSTGYATTKKGFLVKINNVAPTATISGFLNQTTEDTIVSMVLFSSDSPSDINDLRVYWDFGDGSYSYEQSPSHSWDREGTYNVTVYVRDHSGTITSDTETITVFNSEPVIEGPFSFQIAEGNCLILDVAFHDNYWDEMRGLNYSWSIYGFNNTLVLSTTAKKPALNLESGNYTAIFKVIDEKGATASANVSSFVENVEPVVVVASKMYYGAPGNLKLEAYGLDASNDFNDLTFEWTLTNEIIYQESGKQRSIIELYINATGTLEGQVKVFDDIGSCAISEFEILIFIDSNGDTRSDELEYQIGLDPHKSNSDYDGDGLPDFFEITYLTAMLHINSSWDKYDSDNDGLPDGYNSLVGTGEWALGTKIDCNDTDGDHLLDGVEWFGYYVTYQRHISEGNVTIHTSSDPLFIDTDSDGLPDNDEYALKTNARNRDTDYDGYNDTYELQIGRNPLINEDSDGDGLFDVQELAGFTTKWGHIYTNVTLSDTDNDGLSDYEEIYGTNALYRTNPLVNDTDDDGLLDSAETYSMTQSLGKRAQIEKLGLYKGQSNSFTVAQVERAQSAQLTVSLTAGEGVRAQHLRYSLYLDGVLLYVSDPIFNESYHSKVVDVKPLVESKHPLGYGGNWELVVCSDYKCLLDEFKLDLGAYLDPTNRDSDRDRIQDGVELNPELNQGWTTNPMKSDTDDDGWSDFIEIHITDTNPLSADSDADGALDTNDHAPLENVLVKVTIEAAHMADTFTRPKLQVTLNAGKIAVYSEKRWATTEEKTWGPFHWDTTSEWSGDNNDFYFDVDDNWNSEFSLEGRVYLDVFGDYGGWASRLFSETFDYNPAKGNKNDWKIEDGNGDWLKLSFHTEYVSRANTIAVYENGTYSSYYGRYFSQDKMVVVQLDINEESFGIWKKGANTIVIQKAAFASTKLNAAIQQAVDATGTVNWFSMPPCLTTNAELSGLDRQNGKGASEWLELTIAKTECSIDDANAILNLLLTGMVNETTG